MAKQLQIRGGTTAQHSTFTGAVREITIDTDKDVVVVHDGTTVGGFPLAKQTSVDSKVTKVTSTDNAVVRFNGTTGEVQNSGVVIDDNNNVGIGGTPSAFGGYTTVSLDNASSGGIYNIKVNGTETARLQAYSGVFNVAAKGASTNLTFETNGAERMRLDTNGNVGIGVTPSAWNGASKALQVGTVGIQNDIGSNVGSLSTNSYYDNTNHRYIQSLTATRYTQYNGSHDWQTAPSGTAGNAINWTTAMTLDANGNLLLKSGTGALGYGTGAGGVVTQLTSKSTAVALNKPTGVITMNSAALGAGASIVFVFINAYISLYDMVFVSVIDDFGGAYEAQAIHTYNGYCIIQVTNKTGASRSEAIRLSFAVIKGSIA